jgi:hypothetical protein
MADTLAPVGNLYNPFFTVRLYQPTGQKVPLTQDGGGNPPFDIPVGSIVTLTTDAGLGNLRALEKRIDIRNYSNSLVIEGYQETAYRFTLTMNLPYEDALFIIDDEVLTYDAVVEIQWGYLDASGGDAVESDIHLFLLTDINMTLGLHPQIVLAGQDMGSRPLQITETRRTYKKEDFASDLSIVEEIFSRSAPTLSVNADGVPAESSFKKDREGDADVSQTESDWIFFKRLCRDNNITFIIKDNEVLLLDADETAKKDQSYNLVWFQQMENDRDIPMMEFIANPDGSLFSYQTPGRGQKAAFMNRDKGEIEILELTPDLVKNSYPGGSGKDHMTEAGKPKTGSNTRKGNLQPFAELTPEQIGRHLSVSEAVSNLPGRVSQEVVRFKRFAFAKEAKATCMGIPGLAPTQNVKVKGAGITYSGLWQVLNVRHILGLNGYTMEVGLIRGYTTSNPRAAVGKDSSDPQGGSDTTQAPGKGVTADPAAAFGGQLGQFPLGLF